MPDAAKMGRLERRVERSQAAVESFARIGEEFTSIRTHTAEGAARDRIDGLMQLNRDTLAAVQHSLRLAEEELERARVKDQ